MKEVVLTIDTLAIVNFEPNNNRGAFLIHYSKDKEHHTLEKSYALDHPEPIVQDLLKEVKQQGKMELTDDDDILGSLFIIRLLNEDAVEEKLHNFFARLCEKAKTMKHMRTHTEYMKLFDEIKIKELHLRR